MHPVQERYQQERQVAEGGALRILPKLKVNSQVWYLAHSSSLRQWVFVKRLLTAFLPAFYLVPLLQKRLTVNIIVCYHYS